MDKKNIIDFSISKVGASHLPKGVPCQDNSLSWHSEDEMNYISIVCDGHGSKTYVRSDRGSRIAATLTKDILIDYIENKITPRTFYQIKGAVTARPTEDDSLWGAAPRKPLKLMTEAELAQYKQDRDFYDQVKDIRTQDDIFVSIFEEIYTKWLDAITKDSEDDPFTEKEKECLGNNKLVKAYGTTLQAYVRTPYYWFAIQIGDGRMVGADRNLNWKMLTPWDCNCFQNMTTSLCNTNPTRLFRYAFDGTGYFHSAVICSSDGLEDSYGDYDLAPNYLHNFYSGVLGKFLNEGKEATIKNLDDFLPKLSAHGSKDDMSMAGVIDLDSIAEGLKIFEIKSEVSQINKEHEEREKNRKNAEKELAALKDQLNEISTKENSLIAFIKNLLQNSEELNKRISDSESNKAKVETERLVKEEAVNKSAENLDSIIKENESLDNAGRSRKMELKTKHDQIDSNIKAQQDSDQTAWVEMLEQYLKDNPEVEEKPAEIIDETTAHVEEGTVENPVEAADAGDVPQSTESAPTVESAEVSDNDTESPISSPESEAASDVSRIITEQDTLNSTESEDR